MHLLDVIAEARVKGLRRTTQAGLSMLQTQVRRTSPRSQRDYVFISHSIDNSGAPHVLLQIVAEIAAQHDPSRIHVVAPAIAPDQLRFLVSKGVRLDKTAIRGNRLVGMQLGLSHDDFVLVNSSAVREPYQRYILRALRNGRLRHAFWFIHEERTRLPQTAPVLLEEETMQVVRALMRKGSLTVAVPSARAKEGYDELFQVPTVAAVPPRLDIEDEYCGPRTPEEFDRVDFLIAGPTAVGGKGQLLTIAALHELLLAGHVTDRERYREFSLTLIGVGDDYVSHQTVMIAKSVLGERLRTMPRITRDEALRIGRTCNAVICSSISESFGLFVAEGMAMGHVVLRSETGGIDEQLRDGVNGFRVEVGDVRQFSGVLERLLNRRATPNDTLSTMSRASQAMIEPYRHLRYLPRLETHLPLDVRQGRGT